MVVTSTVWNSPNPSRVFIRLCKFLLLIKISTVSDKKSQYFHRDNFCDHQACLLKYFIDLVGWLVCKKDMFSLKHCSF